MLCDIWPSKGRPKLIKKGYELHKNFFKKKLAKRLDRIRINLIFIKIKKIRDMKVTLALVGLFAGMTLVAFGNLFGVLGLLPIYLISQK